MNSNNTYNANLPGPLDYEQLKEYGLAYIRSIANKQWTDFNLHDPGVTIFEALCFALTDLAFRSRFSMADLLTPKGENHPRLGGTLFPAHGILSHEPITVNDYRKLILESVPGIRNVWIEPYHFEISTPKLFSLSGSDKLTVNGLYKISLELENEYYSIKNNLQVKEQVKEIIEESDDKEKYSELFNSDHPNYPAFFEQFVKDFMLKHRNLCEDVYEVKVLTPIPIGLFIEIETKQDADYRQIVTEMYRAINAHVSPSVAFHTLPELIKKGKKPEEIYQGLLPRYGFIDLDELEQFNKKKTLYTSDVLNLLMKIKGIKSIKRIHFTVNEEDKDKVIFNNHNTSITLKDKDCVFSLSPFSWANPDDNGNALHNIHFECEGYSIRPKLIAEPSFLDNRYAKYLDISKEYPLPQGKNRDTGTYYSFQHLFPKAYRMGLESIPDSANNLRKAERMQLKAYLTFFDQFLSDYLAQLSAMERFFAIDGSTNSFESTYFFHELQDSEIVDVKKVLKAKGVQKPSAVDLDRCNRIMDHLLARFNDSFADYTVLTYLSNMEGINANDMKLPKAKSIKYKKQLLSDYAKLSSTRSQTINYTKDWQISNIEQRILNRLGITEPHFRLAPSIVSSDQKNKETMQYVFNDNRDKPYEQTFGIHIIEHLLLFPYRFLNINNFLKLSVGNDNKKAIADPYSFHITVVVPGWLRICQNIQFRNYVENTIRNELPAHVLAKIYWVDPLVMLKLEESYKTFINFNLKKRSFSSVGEDNKEWRDGIENMIGVFKKFKNLYFLSVDYRLLTTEGNSSQAKAFYKGWQNSNNDEELPRIDYVKLDPWYSEDELGFWKFEEKRTK